MPLEVPSRIEPCLIEHPPTTLTDVVTELYGAAKILGSRLHPTTAASLAELVRVMNCYYSNLIEGHDTRPRDIERALANDLHRDAKRRDLQLEARAHIRVQREVDALSLKSTYGEPASIGLLVSETAKGPVRLRFSVESAEGLFPRLFGERAGG